MKTVDVKPVAICRCCAIGSTFQITKSQPAMRSGLCDSCGRRRMVSSDWFILNEQQDREVTQITDKPNLKTEIFVWVTTILSGALLVFVVCQMCAWGGAR